MLRRHFGISAAEARNRLPSWEREMLLRRLSEEFSEKPQRSSGDPFAELPAGADVVPWAG